MIIVRNIKTKINHLLRDEKTRTVFYNSLGSLIVKGFSIIIGFIMTPVYIRFINDDIVLGLWFTLLSIFSWILMFDLGMGNGLRNSLVKYIEADETIKIKSSISSTYAFQLILATLIGLITLPLTLIIDWNNFFDISNEVISNNLLRSLIAISIFGVIGQFVLQTITSIIYALQRTWINNLNTFLISLLQLILIILGKSSEVHANLTYVVITYIIVVNGVLFINTILVFNTILRKNKPSIKFVNKDYILRMLKLGWRFFWIQIVWMLINSSNQLYISLLYGPTNVVTYQVYFKLFFMVATFFGIAITPMWSSITKAHVQKDINWISKAYSAMWKLLLLFAIPILLLLFIMQNVIDLWLGQNTFIVNSIDTFLFSLYTILFMANILVTTIPNATNNLKVQAIIYTFGAILKYPIMLIFHAYNIEWISAVLSNIFILSLFVIIQSLWNKNYLINLNKNAT